MPFLQFSIMFNYLLRMINWFLDIFCFQVSNNRMNKEMIALHNISASNPVAETVQTGEG